MLLRASNFLYGFCILSFWLLQLNVKTIQAQSVDVNKKLPELMLKFEVRPRAEFTNKNFLFSLDSSSPYFNISQRNRLSASYKKKKWLLNSELQELHFWDKNRRQSTIGSINFFQLYVETQLNNFSVRMGRQSVLLDNGRIFSDAPWAQQGRSHEGLRLMHKTPNANSDFFLLFTRKYGNLFMPYFSPVSSHNYKYLLVYHFKYQLNPLLSFNTIQAMDVFSNNALGKNFYRFTSGGRINLKQYSWLYTLNTYMQFGRTPNGKKLLSHYVQPEVQWTNGKQILRLGLEWLSGSSQKLSKNQSGDFDVMYGVAWKFNGNMNLFTKFPADVSGRGLINSYFFTTLPLSNKTSVRSDLHLFYTQFPFRDANGFKQSRFVGFENDISFRHLPKKNLELTGGFSYYLSSRSAQFLPKILDYRKIAVWSYLMVSATWEHKKKRTKSNQ